tara:strand:+ start:5354 stop:5785 length:432 start_codon:yes stop_codon:yes gene_type:complete
MKHLTKNLLIKTFIAVFFIFLAYGSGDSEPEVNLNNQQEVINYVQGRWQFTKYSGSFDYRILIEGNKISIWSKLKNSSWKNNEPEEVNNYSLSDVFSNIDNRECRSIGIDNTSLLLNSMGGLQVVGNGIMHSGASYFVNKGWE